MLDYFHPGSLPGVSPRQYSQSDIATFNDIYAVARKLSLNCVKKKKEAEAGWSSTGKAATSSAHRLALSGSQKIIADLRFTD